MMRGGGLPNRIWRFGQQALIRIALPVCVHAVAVFAVLMTQHIIQLGTSRADLWSDGSREDFTVCVCV